MIAVGAGRYHSAVCTEHEVFTFGKNLGQLGMCVCVCTYMRACCQSLGYVQPAYMCFLFF